MWHCSLIGLAGNYLPVAKIRIVFNSPGISLEHHHGGYFFA